MSLVTLASLIEKAINERGSAAVLRDHLDLIRHGVQVLQDTHDRLEQDNAKLCDQVADLEKQIRAEREKRQTVEAQLQSLSAQQSDYVKHRGALFLVEGGKVETTVYCLKCESPMSSLANHLPFRCHCGYTVGFAGDVMIGVLKEVRAKAGLATEN